jgi:hypothetical protein
VHALIDPAATRLVDAQLALARNLLLHDDARGVQGNWEPAMSYAANLGSNSCQTIARIN